MPPGRKSKKASQSAVLEKYVTKLCAELKRVSQIEGVEDINEDIVESLCVALRSAKATDTIPATAIGNLLATLENQDGQFSCSLDIQTFCVILNVVLHGEDCREGERVLVLVANEICQHSKSQDQEVSRNVVVEIAKAVDVGHLIEYFVDSSKPNGMRRWVGVIMQQLLRGPEAVFEQFQHTPEDIRRSIGPLVLNEENEILRLICGLFLRALLDSDILPDELWPIRTNRQLYEDFPTDSQSQSEWKAQFQEWVDENWPDKPSQTPAQMLYFSNSVVAIPPFRLGALGENMELVLEDRHILLLKTSTDRDLDQILQVPCCSISRVSIIDSMMIMNGKEIHEIVLEIKDDQEVSSYLNSRPTTLQQLRLSTNSDIEELIRDLQEQCPEAEFPPGRVQYSQAEDDIVVHGKGGSPESDNRDGPLEGDEHQKIGRSDPSPLGNEELDRDLDTESEIQAELLRSQEDYDRSGKPLGELKQSRQSLNRNKRVNKPESPGNSGIASFSDSPSMPANQEIPTSSDDAVATDDGDLESSHRELRSKQKDQSRSRISPPMPITKGLPTKNRMTAINTVTTESNVAVSQSSTREAPTRSTQSTTSQAKQSQSTQNTNLNANKGRKNYFVKPKRPIAAPKDKAEHSRPGAPAKAAIISKSRDGSDGTTTPTKTNIYDLPANNEDDQTTAKSNSPKNKITKKKVGGSQKGKASGKGTGKTSKPYQKSKPPPIAAEEPIATKRSSQRAAASQARLSMSKINDDLDDPEDDLSDKRDDRPSQPNVSRKRKTAEQPAEPALLEVKSGSVLDPVLEKDQEALDIEKRDAQELSLVDNRFPVHGPFELDDLNTAGPSTSKDQQNYSEENTKKPSRKIAAANFASQLDDIMNDDADGANKTLHTNTLRNGLFKKKSARSAPPSRLGEPKQQASEKQTTANKKDISEAKFQNDEAYNSYRGRDDDDQDLHLEEEDLAKPDGQQSKEVVPVIPCEIDVIENQVGNKDDIEKDQHTQLPVDTAENETEPLIIIPSQVEPVLKLPSHPLTRFSKTSKLEVVLTSIRSEVVASPVRQYSSESSPLTSPPDVTSPEEKKRKVATEAAGPSKRHRPIATKKSDNPPISGPVSRSQTKTLPESSGSKSKGLLDDRSIRKPKVIHFDSRGAQNQGLSSTSKPASEEKSKSPIAITNMARKKTHDSVQAKRRYHGDEDEEPLFVSQSPPKKRQSISPPDLALPTVASTLAKDDSSPMAPIAFKSSSQGSRVDAFGSPLAQHTIPSMNRILKDKQRAPKPRFGQLAPQTSDFQQDVPTITVASPENNAKDTPEIFGPRIKVVSIAKARPPPPGQSPPDIRYVPHKETQIGTYVGILTAENIQEDEDLPDPFVEDAHSKSSGFTERLRARQTATDSKADGGLNVRFSDPDKTLVEPEEQQSTRESSSPSSNSSIPSGDSSNTPTQELSSSSRWSSAVRPHYNGYRNTVHKIADEMVIRLSNEEDATKLIVDQYNDNATTMLQGLTRTRDLEKVNIRQQIENKKQELIRMYSEAKSAMAQTEKDIKTASMSDVDGKWQGRQEFILKEMKEGRQTLEL